jgi:hypothetical protein
LILAANVAGIGLPAACDGGSSSSSGTHAGAYIYRADSTSTIGRANLNGTGVNQRFISQLRVVAAGVFPHTGVDGLRPRLGTAGEDAAQAAHERAIPVLRTDHLARHRPRSRTERRHCARSPERFSSLTVMLPMDRIRG